MSKSRATARTSGRDRRLSGCLLSFGGRYFSLEMEGGAYVAEGSTGVA